MGKEVLQYLQMTYRHTEERVGTSLHVKTPEVKISCRSPSSRSSILIDPFPTD